MSYCRALLLVLGFVTLPMALVTVLSLAFIGPRVWPGLLVCATIGGVGMLRFYAEYTGGEH